MTPVSDQARVLLDALFAAIEAKPGERRSFCIQRFINASPIVIHKGLVGGRMNITDGVLDEVVQAGLLRKVEPSDPKNCLHVLTDAAFSYHASRKPTARVAAGSRSLWKVVAAAILILAGLAGILTWAGVRP